MTYVAAICNTCHRWQVFRHRESWSSRLDSPQRRDGRAMARQQSGVNTRGIGLELQRLRKNTELSVHDVGERIGTSGSTISRIETGKREATIDEVASILTVLEVTGVERQQLLDQARKQGDLDVVESAT